nr:Biomphalaria glabrata kynurenine formamidase-like; transcript variant X2 [Biomphalaria glabrata]
MKTSLATLFSVLMFTTLVNAVYYYKVPDCVVDFIQKVKTGQNFCLAARTYSNCSVERLHLPASDSEWVYDEILQKWRSMGVNCSTTLTELHEHQEPGSEVSLHYVMGLDRTEQSKGFERLAIILMLMGMPVSEICFR